MITNRSLVIRFISVLCLSSAIGRAAGLSEPGLGMYGVVRNAASGNARLVRGSVTWTIASPNGPAVVITGSLTNIGNQYSYFLVLPFETVIGSLTASQNVLQLKSTPT